MSDSVVLDTQIVVRGLLRRKPSSAVQIFDLAWNRRITGVTSPDLIEELERVLRIPSVRRQARPPLDDETIERFIVALLSRFRRTAGAFGGLERVPLDFRDNPVIEAALEGDADAIVSDDIDLLSLKVVRVSGFRPIQVSAPGPFLRTIRT